MSDTIKLVVEIPVEMFQEIRDTEFIDIHTLNVSIKAIEHGIPLDKIVTNIEKHIRDLKHEYPDNTGYRWWNNALDNALCVIKDETEARNE